MKKTFYLLLFLSLIKPSFAALKQEQDTKEQATTTNQKSNVVSKQELLTIIRSSLSTLPTTIQSLIIKYYFLEEAQLAGQWFKSSGDLAPGIALETGKSILSSNRQYRASIKTLGKIRDGLTIVNSTTNDEFLLLTPYKTITKIAFSPNTEYLAACSHCFPEPNWIGNITIWNLVTKKTIALFTTYHYILEPSLEFSPNNKLLLFSASTPHLKTLTAIRDIENNKEIIQRQNCYNSSFLSDNVSIFSQTGPTTMNIWNSVTGEQSSIVTSNVPIKTAKISPNGTTILAIDEKGQLHEWQFSIAYNLEKANNYQGIKAWRQTRKTPLKIVIDKV